MPADRIKFLDNEVLIGNRAIAFPDLVKQAYLGRISLSSTGFYRTPEIHWDAKRATGRPFYLLLLRRGLRRGHRRHADRRE